MLALEQAAAYMQATGTSLARYLKLFQLRQADLLARGEAPGHRDHVAATLGLALSRLGKDAPAAAGLMRLLAVLTPSPVPLGLLLAEDDPEQGLKAKATGTLGAGALVAPAGDGLIHVHRLAQAVTRAQLTDREVDEWQHAAAALVEAVIPADGQLPCARSPTRTARAEITAPSTPSPCPLAMNSPSGPARRVMRPGPATSTTPW